MVFSSVTAAGLKDAGTKATAVADKAGATTYSSVDVVVGQAINAALSIVGLIFMILMIYAGYLWMTARGEESQVEKAQKIIISTMIGFVIVASAYAITVLVAKRFQSGSQETVLQNDCEKQNPGWSCVDINTCNATHDNPFDEDEEDLEAQLSDCEQSPEICKVGKCMAGDNATKDNIICCAPKK